MASVTEALTQAVYHHQSGNLQVAEQMYRQILAVDPNQVDALHFLGVVASQTGRFELALQLIGGAMTRQMNNPLCHLNLGNVYQMNGRWQEAVTCYQRALQLQPTSFEAHHNLAHALRQLGRLNEAEACCRQALQIQPQGPEGHHNLGNTLRALGRLPEAAASFQQSLRIQPNAPAAWNDLGATLKAMGQIEAAITVYQQALRLQPQFPEALTNLGAALASAGHLDDAIACHQQAIRWRPNLIEAYLLLGNAFLERGDLDAALASYREALRLQPRNAMAHSNLLLARNYHPIAEGLAAEHRHWAEQHGSGVEPARKHDNQPDPERPLRVGYVSADLRDHPVAHFLEPILANHKPARVEMFCYAEAAAPDEVTARLQKLVPNWRVTFGQNDSQVAEQVRKDGIDILVDLGGHTANNRLGVFLHKPAPVQVTYLGYPNTTGLKVMDYFLTDAVADPNDQAPRYVEKLVRFQSGFCCYRPPEAAPPVGALPLDRQGRVTFGALHRLAKLNPQVLDAWSALLRAVPSARLLIFRNTLAGGVREHLLRQFAERSIAADRLDLRNLTPAGQNYWSIYQEIDIALDAFPWSGHTTCCEALWMGVPVVTLLGDRHAGRMVASVLTSVGLADWIAATPEQYVAMAANKSQDRDGLRVLRAGLREHLRTGPLCDGHGFTRKLEQAYRTMWRAWCARK